MTCAALISASRTLFKQQLAWPILDEGARKEALTVDSEGNRLSTQNDRITQHADGHRRRSTARELR
jgi:hypothetical protein